MKIKILSATLLMWLAPTVLADEKPQAVAFPVKLETLNPSPLVQEIRTLATVQQDPRRSAILSARTSGWIDTVAVLPGANVKKGDVLATLDSMDFRAAHNEVKQAQAALNAASELLGRKQKLAADELVSRNDLTAAQLAWQQAKAQLEVAKSRFKMLGVSGSSGGPVAITAPFSGTILTATLRQQQAVTPADPLFTLTDLSSLMIVANVPESQIRYLTSGAAVRIQSSAWPDTAFSGQVMETAGTLDPVTRTLPVRISVNNQAQKLKPEMMVTAFIRYALPAPVLSVPDSALTLMNGKTTVFVAGKTGEYLPVIVQTGMQGSDRTEITAGLKAGDRVATDKTYELKSRLLIAETAGGH